MTRVINILFALDCLLFSICTLGRAYPYESFSSAAYRAELNGRLYGWPPKDCYTISSRMAHYRLHCGGFKRFFAETLCNLLSELDPTGNHC